MRSDHDLKNFEGENGTDAHRSFSVGYRRDSEFKPISPFLGMQVF